MKKQDWKPLKIHFWKLKISPRYVFSKKMLRNTQQNGMKQRLFIIYSDKAISNLSYRKAKE